MYEVFCIADDGSHFGGCYHSEEWQALRAVIELVDEGYTVGVQYVQHDIGAHRQEMLDLWNQ